MSYFDREAAILRLLRLSKRQLAEQLVDTRHELVEARGHYTKLGQEVRQLRNDIGIERGGRGE